MNASPELLRQAKALLLVLSLVNLVNYIDRYVIAAILAPMQADLGIGDTEAGALATAFLLAYMLASPVSGWLGDRVPRPRLAAAGLLLWTLGGLGCAFSQDYTQLRAARLLIGAGEAGYAVVAPAMIAQAWRLEERGRALAWFYLAIPVGAALAYALGGAVAGIAGPEAGDWGGQLGIESLDAGWRWAFFVAAAPGALLIVPVWRLRVPQRAEEEMIPLASSPAAGEGKTQGLPTRALLSNEAFGVNLLGAAMMTFTLGGLGYWVPTFLQRAHGFDTSQAGLSFGAVAVVAGAIGTAAGGRWGDRAQSKKAGGYFRVSAWGLVAGAPLVVMAAYAPTPALCLAAAFFAEIALFLNTGPLNAALVGCVPAGLRARAVAWHTLGIHALGDAISPPMMGAISEHSERSGADPGQALALALAFTALPVAFGGALLLWGAKRLDQRGRLEF